MSHPITTVPHGHPTATIYLDESGSKAKDLFTIAGLKVRKSGLLARNIMDLRDRHNFRSELKFHRLNQGSMNFALEAIDILAASDAQLVGTVVNPAIHDPFAGIERWRAHANVASQLPGSVKGIVAGRLGLAFGNHGLRDGRGTRYRLATWRDASSGRRSNVTVLPVADTAG